MIKKETIIPIVNKEKYFQERLFLIEFLVNNKQAYSSSAYNYLMDFIFKNKGLGNGAGNFTDIATQLFSLYELFNEGCDIYLEFTKILEQYDFLRGDVLEVGGGVYPRLAEIIAPKIKNNGGTLTVYDPRLGAPTTEDAEFYRKKFTLDTDVSKINTIIGIFPCNATTTIVEQAINNDKNFLIACCACDHSSVKYPRWNFGKYWADDLCVMLKDDYGDDIDIQTFNPQLKNAGFDTPIIARKVKKP